VRRHSTIMRNRKEARRMATPGQQPVNPETEAPPPAAAAAQPGAAAPAQPAVGEPPIPPKIPRIKVSKLEMLVVTLLCLVIPVVATIRLEPARGWLLVGATMTLYLLFLGRWIVGRPLGVLINERNLMSLSRFQMIAWTVLLLSAFVVIALKRLAVLS